MLNKSAKKITDMLLSHQVISGEQYDIYVYGFELLISFLFSTMLILIAGIIFRAFIRTLAFLVVFIILRSFTGGFHAKTYAVCTVITLSTYASVMLLSSFMSVNFIAYAALFLIGFTLLFIFAPVENPNKSLTFGQKKKHKIISLIIYFIFCAFGVGMNFAYPLVGATVYFALVADIILLFVPILAKGGRSNA